MVSVGRHMPGAFWIGPLVAIAGALVPGTAFGQQLQEPEARIDPAERAPDSEAVGTGARSLTGTLAFLSDYRFRGVSNSDLSPAIQASIQLDTASGLFMGIWGSSIADLDGASAEIDVAAGWSGAIGALDISAGGIAYLFPGGRGTEVVELFGTAGFALGPTTATLGLNWAPEQANLDRPNRYAHATVSAAIPGKPLTLKASLGHETGSLPLRRNAGTAAKWDWQVGADINFPSLTIGVAYVGTDLPSRSPSGNSANRLGRDGVLVRMSATF